MASQRRKKRELQKIFSRRHDGTVVRGLTEADRAALEWVGTSGLFTLEASARAFAGIKRIRPNDGETGGWND